MNLRNTFQKTVGLFVEIPQEESGANGPVTKTVEELVREAPGPNLDEIKVPSDEPQKLPPPNGGKPDFAAIYKYAGVPDASFGADQALEVMRSLPQELPIDVRRKTVQATLGAMSKTTGVNTMGVVADASRKMAALASYGDHLTTEANHFVATNQAQIESLNSQIAQLQKANADAQKVLELALKSCHDESTRVDEVLEFFSKDVPPSSNA